MLEFMAKENNYIISQISIRANDFFIDHFQIIKSYIDDSLVSSIHFNAIHIPNIFERKRKREKRKQMKICTVAYATPWFYVRNFFHARYKKKRLEYKRLVTQIP